jgi:hypothetical protein
MFFLPLNFNHCTPTHHYTVLSLQLSIKKSRDGKEAHFLAVRHTLPATRKFLPPSGM